MKRIISGFAFRAIRTPILWILVAVTIWAVIANTFSRSTSYEYVEGEGSYTFRNAVAEDPEITAEYAYKIIDDPSAFDKDSTETKKILSISQEINEYTYLHMVVVILPDIAVVLFVTFFFGRLFSDGTVRNLVASGHSKRYVFLASSIFSAFISLFFQIISLTTLAVSLRIFEWQPPIWMPLDLTMDLTYCLLTILIASLILLLLFSTGKQILSLVVGVILFLTVFTGSSGVTIAMLTIKERDLNFQKISEYREDNPDKKIDVDYNMDYITLRGSYTLTVDGEQIDAEPFYREYNKGYVSGNNRRFMLTLLNINPITIHYYELSGLSLYELYSNGRYAFAAGVDIAWIVLFTGAGTIIFNKKELS